MITQIRSKVGSLLFKLAAFVSPNKKTSMTGKTYKVRVK